MRRSVNSRKTRCSKCGLAMTIPGIPPYDVITLYRAGRWSFKLVSARHVACHED